MFSDKRLGWKLAGALALAALFGTSSGLRGREINPPLHRLLALPDHWDGAPLWLPSAVVTSTQPGYLLVEVDGLRLPVKGAFDAAPGDVVSLRGTFRARERRLELENARKLGPGSGLRWVLEAVSLLALAWVVANFLRHFKGPR